MTMTLSLFTRCHFQWTSVHTINGNEEERKNETLIHPWELPLVLSHFDIHSTEVFCVHVCCRRFLRVSRWRVATFTSHKKISYFALSISPTRRNMLQGTLWPQSHQNYPQQGTKESRQGNCICSTFLRQLPLSQGPIEYNYNIRLTICTQKPVQLLTHFFTLSLQPSLSLSLSSLVIWSGGSL